MKNIKELNEKEILALTTEELESMVKYEMANKGIKILSMPLTPEYEAMPPRTENTFTVTGFAYVFKDEEMAKRLSKVVQEVRSNMLNTSYNNTYDLKYIKAIDEYSSNSIGNVTAELNYNKESVDIANEINKRNKAVKQEYETALAEYNTAKDESSHIRDDIFNSYHAVQKKFYDFNLMASRYDEYLSIANGDKDMAMAFLKKAYSVSEEAEDYIIANQKEEAIKPPLQVSKETSSIDDELPNF